MLSWARTWRLPCGGLRLSRTSFSGVPVAPSSSGRGDAEPRSVKGARWEAVLQPSSSGRAPMAPPSPLGPASSQASPPNLFPTRLRMYPHPCSILQIGAAFLQASGWRRGPPSPRVSARALRLQNQLQLYRQGPGPTDRAEGELPGEEESRGRQDLVGGIRGKRVAGPAPPPFRLGPG